MKRMLLIGALVLSCGGVQAQSSSVDDAVLRACPNVKAAIDRMNAEIQVEAAPVKAIVQWPEKRAASCKLVTSALEKVKRVDAEIDACRAGKPADIQAVRNEFVQLRQIFTVQQQGFCR